MSKTLITLARNADCLELAELSRVAIEYDLPWRWKPSRLLGLIQDPDSSVIVARDQSKLLGFAAMQFGETSAHLNLLATVPQHRRQGVGKLLLTWLEESAMTAGLSYIGLEVRLNNQSAVKFYEAQDYRIEKIHRGYYERREDAYRMRRDLIDHEVALKRP